MLPRVTPAFTPQHHTRCCTLLLLVAAITFIFIYNSVYRLKLYITTRINSKGVALASPLNISRPAPTPSLIKHQNHMKFIRVQTKLKYHVSTGPQISLFGQIEVTDTDERQRLIKGPYLPRTLSSTGPFNGSSIT